MSVYAFTVQLRAKIVQILFSEVLKNYVIDINMTHYFLNMHGPGTYTMK
jgi:hypothetical protein